MNIDFSKLLYLPLDIPNPPNAVAEFSNAVDSDFLIDNYRNCKHLPIFKVDRKTNKYDYTEIGKNMPALADWLENEIFSWADRGDVVIITTQPNELNPSHIDCSPKKFANTIQHKFRYVCQGKIDTLNFEHSKGITTPEHIDASFIMSGKWPHHMLNTNNIKYTLALGAPWDPKLNDLRYVSLLEKSYEKYKRFYLSYDQMRLRENWVDLFEQNRGYEVEIEKYIDKDQVVI